MSNSEKSTSPILGRILLVLGFLLVVYGTCKFFDASRFQGIIVSPSNIELSKSSDGERNATTFEITNPTPKRPVQIENITMSCGCAKVTALNGEEPDYPIELTNKPLSVDVSIESDSFLPEKKRALRLLVFYRDQTNADFSATADIILMPKKSN